MGRFGKKQKVKVEKEGKQEAKSIKDKLNAIKLRKDNAEKGIETEKSVETTKDVQAKKNAGAGKGLKKEKSVNKEKNSKKVKDGNKAKQKSKVMLFSIRNKIIVCFLVPILFMIVIGTVAYQRAASGMSEKYSESTQQTINMAVEYVDMSCNFIEAEGLKYAFDSELSKYFVGLYETDKLGKMNLMNNVKSNIVASQTSNDFISDIHIVTKAGVYMLSTAGSSNCDGIYEEYRETVASGKRGIEKWVDDHPLIDETLQMRQKKYIMAYKLR